MPLNSLLKELELLHPKKIDLSLGRMQRLLDKLGNPEQRMPPTIHVAGTNGKGSTIAFMRSIAEAAGLKAHIYTSPHLVRFNERIVLAGQEVSDAELCAALGHVTAINAGDPITFFESTTAAAFWLFAQQPADLLLLEVGLGGRLDATNVLIPAVTAITPIGIDHTEFLGDTLTKIALEKAGIMKANIPCAVAPQAPEVMAVLETQAALVGCSLLSASSQRKLGSRQTNHFANLKAGLDPSLHWDDTHKLALVGPHQQINASVAIECLRQLHHSAITTAAIQQGLQTAYWPGRLEQITRGVIWTNLPSTTALWFDGAHNESGAMALAAQLQVWKKAQPIHLYFAMLNNRDPKMFLSHLLPYLDSVICVDMPEQPNAWPANELQKTIQGIAPTLPCYTNLTEWQKTIGDTQNILLATGSLYFYAQIVKN